MDRRLMFTLAGLIGMVVTAIAWRSRSYRQLSRIETKQELATIDV
jgi:hypothetical protein